MTPCPLAVPPQNLVRWSRSASHPRLAFMTASLALGLLVNPSWAGVLNADHLTGEQIYFKHCASCHGDMGEGGDLEDSWPLEGDRPLADLEKLIEKTMPKADPGGIVGEEARKVARYVYDSFYSDEARAQRSAARIELARLTVRQYQNVAADLIASFHSGHERKPDLPNGLAAEYYASRRIRREDRKIERVDPGVQFRYDAQGSPDPEQIPPKEFAIKWQGSIVAPATGRYDLILQADNGARLWFNDDQTALIDAWVKSGDDSRYEAEVHMVAGRRYRIRLEWFKGEKDTSAALTLKWKPPGGVEEPIPARVLRPEWSPPAFALATPFPPDDRSAGYERGTAISREWHEATTEASLEIAGYVAANLPRLAKFKNEDPTETKLKATQDFCATFAERAFRRPLTESQRRFFVDRWFESADEPEAGLKRALLLILKSPRFLYREVADPVPNAPGGVRPHDDYDVAARLSFTLWDSIPDRELLDAAAKGQLREPDQVQAQARRMLDDPRARVKVREFLHQWLRVDHLHDLSKDSSQFPDFDPLLVSDLKTSLDLMLDEIVWSEASDFRRLLLAETVPLNARLARFYGLEPGEGEDATADFRPYELDAGERAGVLTHPLLLAGFAYHSTSSPIHRGVFVSRSLLGRSLKPPPAAVSPLAPDLHPNLTTRERVILQTSPASCMNCHGMINSLGFPLEKFDAVGRLRTEDHGKPIDDSGSYLTRSGDSVTFQGARPLAAFLAQSPEAHRAFVEQLFHYLVKQPIQAFGPSTSADLRRTFIEGEFRIRDLLTEIALVAAFADPPQPDLE